MKEYRLLNQVTDGLQLLKNKEIRAHKMNGKRSHLLFTLVRNGGIILPFNKKSSYCILSMFKIFSVD